MHESRLSPHRSAQVHELAADIGRQQHLQRLVDPDLNPPVGRMASKH